MKGKEFLDATSTLYDTLGILMGSIMPNDDMMEDEDDLNMLMTQMNGLDADLFDNFKKFLDVEDGYTDVFSEENVEETEEVEKEEELSAEEFEKYLKDMEDEDKKDPGLIGSNIV